MIAALRYYISEDCWIDIYLSGTYSNIDWNSGEKCILGDSFAIYGYKNKDNHKVAIKIENSLDERPILRLVETKRYIAKITRGANGQDWDVPRFQNQENKYLKCETDKDSITFQFVNYLGRSHMRFGNSTNLITIDFEVVPDKIDYEKDYINITEALAEVCSELLLEYSGATSNLYSLSNEPQKTVLEQFIFLRQFCHSQNIYSLFEIIKRNPDRKLECETEYKRIGQSIPSKKFYTNPFSYSKSWQRFSGENEFLPAEVATDRKFDSLDTPANRFVKFALEKFDYICSELILKLSINENSKRIECVEEAKAIHYMITNIFQDDFWKNVGQLEIIPQNNQVLQKRAGYNQIFSAYMMIDLALQLDWSGEKNAYEGESKNVALLYEYWLFFELYKIIKSIDGCSLIDSCEKCFIKFADGGVSIYLKEGEETCQSFCFDMYDMKLNLYYNRTFGPKTFKSTKYEGSYSRPFRPDYTIALFPNYYESENQAVKAGAISYIHFDAKYRISDLTSFIGDMNDDEIKNEKIDSIVNTYNRGDLLKMHTYNDAIRRSIGSYVLYPGTSDKHAEYHLYEEILPGVGAFAIKPSLASAGTDELRNFIQNLLKIRKQTYSRLNRLQYYTEMIVREPSANGIQVLSTSKITTNGTKKCVLGYLKDDNEKDYYRFLCNNGMLEVGSEFLFYFYAIKEQHVYTHHQDIFSCDEFRLYSNDVNRDELYVINEPVCKVLGNELISKDELAIRLKSYGYVLDDSCSADFYYILKLKIVNVESERIILTQNEVNAQNGNDCFSVHSPKIVSIGDCKGGV